MSLSNLPAALGYYIIPLALTVCVEGAAAFACGFQKEEQKSLLLVNFATNPAINLLLYFSRSFTPLPDAFTIPLLEICVVAAEALLLKRLCGKSRRWLAYSLLFNALSLGAGLLLTLLIRS